MDSILFKSDSKFHTKLICEHRYCIDNIYITIHKKYFTNLREGGVSEGVVVWCNTEGE